mgnify:FL=1
MVGHMPSSQNKHGWGWWSHSKASKAGGKTTSDTQCIETSSSGSLLTTGLMNNNTKLSRKTSNSNNEPNYVIEWLENNTLFHCGAMQNSSIRSTLFHCQRVRKIFSRMQKYYWCITNLIVQVSHFKSLAFQIYYCFAIIFLWNVTDSPTIINLWPVSLDRNIILWIFIISVSIILSP